MAVRVGDLRIRARVETKEGREELRSFAVEVQRTGVNMGAVMRRAAGLVGFGGLTLAIRSAVKEGLEFNMMMDRSRIALTTMLGSAQRAGTMIKDLQEFARETPFAFEDLVSMTQRLTAFGFEQAQIIPMLRTIGDAAAGLGGGAAMIDRITLALGQMQAKGRAASQEMMQLTEAGIPAWQYLADYLRTDVATAMDMVERRSVSAAEAIQAVLSGMQADYAGMMEKQSETLEGAISNIQDSMQQILGAMTESLAMFLADMLGVFVERNLPKIQAFIEEGVQAWRDILGLGTQGPGLAEQAGQALEEKKYRKLAENIRADIAELERRREEFGELTQQEERYLEDMRQKLAEIEHQAHLAYLELFQMRVEAGKVPGVDTWALEGNRAIGVSELYGRKIAEDTERIRYEERMKAERRAQVEIAKLDAERAEEAGREWQSALERAFEDASSKFSSALRTGIQNATKLHDLVPDLFAPGANGPFENLYRALDVAVHGESSPWAKVLGLTQEDARRISEQFQKGLFTPEVIALIDKDKLKAVIQEQIAAEQSLEQFSDQLAGELGVDPAVIQRAMGGTIAYKGMGAQAGEYFQEGLKAGASMEGTLESIISDTERSLEAKKARVTELGRKFGDLMVGGMKERFEDLVDMLVDAVMAQIGERQQFNNWAAGYGGVIP